jgi:hypothetical protein
MTQTEKLLEVAYAGFNISELESILRQVRKIVDALHAKDFTTAADGAEYLHMVSGRLYDHCLATMKIRSK